MPASNRELMVAYQQGDPEAFAILYDRHSRALANYFYKMCYDRALAEDLVQETWLRVIRSRDRYEPKATFRTFLFTVATNLYIDRHRSRKSAPKMVSADLPAREEGATIGDLIESRDRAPGDKVDDREAAALVQQALQQLPEGQREVFLLAESQGLKYREISEILGIPVGTVKSRMNAAITQLRGMLGRALG